MTIFIAALRSGKVGGLPGTSLEAGANLELTLHIQIIDKITTSSAKQVMPHETIPHTITYNNKITP